MFVPPSVLLYLHINIVDLFIHLFYFIYFLSFIVRFADLIFGGSEINELGFCVLIIITKKMKSGIQNLKRCSKLEEESPPQIQKKPKLNNAFYSFHDGEIHSNSASTDLNIVAENAPPLSRASRGRVKMLPSKFKDSVLLGTQKKNNRQIQNSKLSFEGESSDTVIRFVNKGKENKCDPKKESDNGFDEFDYEKHAKSFKSIKKTVKGSRMLLVKAESGNCFDEKGKKGKEIFKLVDFHLGDIVWAKCGKTFPAWPAVVIDPISQAPESVLRRCVPDAICVMFFGYSKNGKHRVSSSQHTFM